ncbi:MAG: ABC-2 family transporter protein [Methanomassiliicoccales archaeon PtaU1.Bin124]|nr:MAG: ABC-2 family transporter protein [Methanomassiliicoccales archaeon PtaU1.Bin124]
MMDLERNLLGLMTVFKFEARKLLLHKRWMFVVVLAILVGAVMGYSATRQGADIGTASDMLNLLVLTFLLPVMALIYGASMVRNEMDDRSIIQVVTSPLDRRTSYIAYYLALTVVLVILLIIITLVGGLSFMAFNGASGGPELMLAFMAVLCIGAIAYSSLFLVIGLVMKQPLYLGLFYVFVWEYFIGSVPGAVGELTIRHQLQVIASGLTDKGSFVNISGDPTTSLLAMLVMAVILVVVGAFLFREKEIA